MALFREHVSFGAVVATIGTVLTYYYAYVTDWRLLLAVFVATIIGSFLPDLDSDSSVPFNMLMSILTLMAVGLSFYLTLVLQPEDVLVRFGVPLLAGGFVWFILGWLLKRLTVHRGMFHSLPAVVIVGLLAYLLVHSLLALDFAALVLGGAVALGYLAHLVLDEFHAGVNIDGSLFSAKRSLGTALKLHSTSRIATVFTYGLLAVLLYTVLV
jgi:hypothetical protein